MKFDKSIKLVVEGPTDINFLKDFIEMRFSIEELPREVFIQAENNSLKSIRGQVETANKRGEVVLVIFDADNNSETTRARLNDESSKLGVDLDDIFLIPNNESIGNLEVLLRSVIHSGNEEILNCIDQYASCIGERAQQDLRVINDKAKVFIYVDSYKVGGSGKPGDIDFKEKKLWNLNSDNLQPLYEFLAPHFQ